MNNIGKIEILGHATKREWTVYILVANPRKINKTVKFYVGKTGDNRKGCNPVISRVGNHFSMNKVHSQLRNKILATEDYDYEYHYCHFGEYNEESVTIRDEIDRINELERELNRMLQNKLLNNSNAEILNPYSGRYVTSKEIRRRGTLITVADREQLSILINEALTITQHDQRITPSS